MSDVLQSPVRELFQGCLVGAAVGDALGAPVEFLARREIVLRFGARGVMGMEAARHEPAGAFPPGSITDDTQMTMATARACLEALPSGDDDQLVAAAWREYVAWRKSQDEPRLRRGPGATCLAALEGEDMPAGGLALNDSKGCGAVMRIAPVGLALSPERAFAAGAALGRLTHGHRSGFLSAAFLAAAVSRVARGAALSAALDGALGQLAAEDGCEETLAAVRGAVALAGGDATASVAPASVALSVSRLGRGWVGEEALAIAVYCSLRFAGDWRAAVLAAVNHSGDSDSTGCVTGALSGAALGLRSVPHAWARAVEERETLLALAEGLYEVARCA